jgi:hypothetical protein
MPPKARKSENPNSWWDSAYYNMPHIETDFNYQFGNDVITPGMKIRIKHKRGIFKFRCVAHNSITGTSWIDVIEEHAAFRSFRLSEIREVVKPRRPRRKRTVAKV